MREKEKKEKRCRTMFSRSAMQGWLRCSSPRCHFGLLSLDQITQLLYSKTSPYHDSPEFLLYMAAGVWTHNWNAASYQHLSPGRPLSLSRAGTVSSSNSISEAPAGFHGNQACLCADTFSLCTQPALGCCKNRASHQMGGLLRSGTGRKTFLQWLSSPVPILPFWLQNED